MKGPQVKRQVISTLFEKGKPVERPGRKATGLKADPLSTS